MACFVICLVIVVNLAFVSSVEVDEETLRRLVQEEVGKILSTRRSSSSSRKDRGTRLVLDNEEDLWARVRRLESSLAGTYVRWGRTDCPKNGTELVYKGYAGGNSHVQTGGGANYLCLPEDPIYGYVEAGHQTSSSVYGAEYELDHTNIAGFIQQNLHQDNVPCAVCRTIRSSVLMIPARNACYDGWTLEYKGYLTGGYDGHVAASEYVCLDDHPIPVPGGHANTNGKLFYLAEGRCGTLECPPYVDGQELTCAVCSK